MYQPVPLAPSLLPAPIQAPLYLPSPIQAPLYLPQPMHQPVPLVPSRPPVLMQAPSNALQDTLQPILSAPAAIARVCTSHSFCLTEDVEYCVEPLFLQPGTPTPIPLAYDHHQQTSLASSSSGAPRLFSRTSLMISRLSTPAFGQHNMGTPAVSCTGVLPHTMERVKTLVRELLRSRSTRPDSQQRIKTPALPLSSVNPGSHGGNAFASLAHEFDIHELYQSNGQFIAHQMSDY
jgi:hypothetical protein